MTDQTLSDDDTNDLFGCTDTATPVVKYRRSPESKALLDTQYNNIFEVFVERIAKGVSLKSQVEDDSRIVSYEAFLSWIKRDPIRHERYKAAQELRTEKMALEILDIADGVDSVVPEEVNRSKLRIDSRKFLMGCWNRGRYGDVKTVDIGGTISITNALEQARMRVFSAGIIDVETKD